MKKRMFAHSSGRYRTIGGSVRVFLTECGISEDDLVYGSGYPNLDMFMVFLENDEGNDEGDVKSKVILLVENILIARGLLLSEEKVQTKLADFC